jgi:hypothetical protein
LPTGGYTEFRKISNVNRESGLKSEQEDGKMRKHITIWTMVLSVLFLGSSAAHATVDFDSGGTETFNSYEGDSVRVDYNIANSPGTHLRVTDGAYIDRALSAYHNGQIIMTGGTAANITSYDNSRVTFTDNANASYVAAVDNCRMRISGGTISQNIQAYGDSSIDITGGNFTKGLYAIDNSVITITGAGFKVGNVNVAGYLDIAYLVSMSALTDNVGTDGISHQYSGTITGTLADGTALLGNTITIWHRSVGGVLMDEANFNFVPEPASLLLLALGGLALRGRRK